MTEDKRKRGDGTGTVRVAPMGARIRAARLAAGMTQEQIARIVGVSRSAVAQWETDRTGQVGGNLVRIAAALGVEAGHLLTGTTLTPPPSETGDEIALLRLYREAAPDDRQLILRTAMRLARSAREE